MKARAPYRVSLFGGGSDYPEWYREHGGIAVNFTIQKYIQVEYRAEMDQLTRLICNRDGAMGVGGLAVSSDLPRESGMGGSATYAVALLAATRGKIEDRMELAIDGYNYEVMAGRTVGLQDHLAAAHGGLKIYRFEKSGAIEIGYTTLTEREKSEMCRHMMLVNVPRLEGGGDIASRYNGRDMTHSVIAAYDGLSALEARDWEKMGRMLSRAWAEKRRWAQGVTTVAVDGIVERAMHLGAWGCKLLGAGSGGFVLVMAEDTEKVWRGLIEDGRMGGKVDVLYEPYGVQMWGGKRWV